MSKKHRGTVNERMIQKIDCMVEDTEYKPYTAVKRNITDTNELFGDTIYESQESNTQELEYNNEKKGINIAIICVVVLMLAIVGGLVYLISIM